MTAATILARKGNQVITITEELTLRDAARALAEHKIGAVVVVDGAGMPSGVFSERDLTREVAAEGGAALDRPVSAAMTSGVVTASPGDTVDALMNCMSDRRIRHLPVMENGALVGIVSIGDVVKRKIEDAQADAEAMRAYITTG